jgi:glucokinase
MTPAADIFIGTDCGATTSKTTGIWSDGSPVSTHLRQVPTPSGEGTSAVIRGWISGAETFLADNGLAWSQVRGVGLAIPGPYERYGVLGRSANLPPGFAGWNFLRDYRAALSAAAGRPIPLVAGNDGRLAGVAEARIVSRDHPGSVLMFAPGSGLGCAYIDRNGLALEGETLTGMEAAHMPAPLQLLGMPSFPCGCGRTWGCVEVYTSISGLPHLLAEMLKKYPGHPLATSPQTSREKALSLRQRAQEGDELALEIFDFQARALGLHLGSLAIAFDPKYVVIGGGLMDPHATTPAFRERYLGVLRTTALECLWPAQRRNLEIAPARLGELSQAIGAALTARHAAANATELPGA